jgi:hypothetical protein
MVKGTSSIGIFLGFPLLLHLCSYERIRVGRPLVKRDAYVMCRYCLDMTQPTGPLWARCGATDPYMFLNFVR